MEKFKVECSVHSYRRPCFQETSTEGMGNDEPNRVVKTQMTQMTEEQVERFEEDWINLWKPAMDTENL